MTCNSTVKRHAALFDRMAASQGIDLEESVLRGKITPNEVVDAVLSCTGCARPDTCSRWLKSSKPALQPTPDYCRNGSLLRQLSKPKSVSS
jgi:hypothetical protein